MIKFLILSLLILAPVLSVDCPSLPVSNDVCDCSGAAGTTKWNPITQQCINACASPNGDEQTISTYDTCTCPSSEVYDPVAKACAADCSGNSGQSASTGEVCRCSGSNVWNPFQTAPGCVSACPTGLAANKLGVCECATAGQYYDPFLSTPACVATEADCTTGTSDVNTNKLCAPTVTTKEWNPFQTTPGLVDDCPTGLTANYFKVCECADATHFYDPFLSTPACVATEGACSTGTSDVGSNKLCAPTVTTKEWNPFQSAPALVDDCPTGLTANYFKICQCADATHFYDPFLATPACVATVGACTTGTSDVNSNKVCAPTDTTKEWNPFLETPALVNDCPAGLTANYFKICQCSTEGQVYDSRKDGGAACVAVADCSYGNGAQNGVCACTTGSESFITILSTPACGTCPTGMTVDVYDVCSCPSASPVYDPIAQSCVANSAACTSGTASTDDKKVCVCSTSGQGYNKWLGTPACGACPEGTSVDFWGMCACPAATPVYDPIAEECVANSAACTSGTDDADDDKICECSTAGQKWDKYLSTPACAADCSGEATANDYKICQCATVWDGIQATPACADKCPANSEAKEGKCECKDGYELKSNACSKKAEENKNSNSVIVQFTLALVMVIALLF